MNEFDRGTFRLLLAAFMEDGDLTVRQVAKAIGCSEATLTRILAAKTSPTDELMRQGGAMFELGFERYSKLTVAEREKISEAIGTVGGGVLGFGSITAAVGTLGTVSGLSAAGISSGLAALGGLVGGGMIAGVSVAAAIPLAVGAVGYAVIKGVKHLASESHLNATELDASWEMALDS